MLKTAVIGKTVNGTTQLSRLMVMSGDRIVLVDATTGQPPKKVTTKMVNKDLHIFADGASEPSVILNDYASFEQTVQISGIDSNGAYVNYATAQAGSMELGAVSAEVAPASAPLMSTSAWWGVGILAVAGGVAVAAGGGGGSSSSSTTETPVVSTQTAFVVDSLVSGISYTTSSGITGVTGDAGSVGSFRYKTGDTVTFTVGGATLATNVVIPADGIVMPQDMVGVDRTNTTDSRVVNIAQFLQSLDSVGTVADGITIDPADAAAITTNINVQTVDDIVLEAAVDQALGTTSTTTDLVSTQDAIDHLNLTLGDEVAPTAIITLPENTVFNTGETATVTITFSESVVDFSNADVTAQNGTLSTFTSSANNTVWTATFTPTANLSLDNTNTITLASTYTDAAGNTGTAATSVNYTVNTLVTPPSPISLVITDDENGIANIDGGSIIYKFTFGESVTGFTVEEITVVGGIKGTFAGSGSLYTLEVIPLPTATTLSVGVAAGVVTTTDGASNLEAVASLQLVDMLAPTALTLDLLAANDTGLDNTDNITSSSIMTVSGIETGATWEYSLDGGSNWTSGSGTSFNLVDNTTYAINSIQVRQSDAAGNISPIVKNAEVITVDVKAPILTITNNQGTITANMDGSNGDGTPDADGADILYTFKFSEDVTGFDIGDITITNGTAKTFTKISESEYTLGITPTAGVQDDLSTPLVNEGILTVAVANTAYNDIAGNTTSASSMTSSTPQVIDMLAPVLNDITFDGTNDWTYDYANKSIIFTLDSPLEAVNMTSPDNFIVTINTKPRDVVAVSMLDNKVTLIMADTFTSVEGVRVVYKDATTDLSAAIQDLAGNDATSFTYLKPDVTPPSVINVFFANPSLIIGQSSQVTIMFSEEIKDVVVSYQNGTLTDLKPDANDASIWRATFTASNAIEDANSELIVVSFHDLENVANITTGTAFYSIDTLAPSVSITDDESSVGNIAGGVINYTFTFTEAVQNFTVQDITVKGGAKGVFSGSGSVYTLEVTPTAGFEGDVTVDVAAGKTTDLLGNLNTAADQSIQTVDMKALLAPTFKLTTDGGIDNTDSITNVGNVTVVPDSTAKNWEYSVNGGTSWTVGNGTTFNLANAIYTAGDIRVHQIDEAGNISAETFNSSDIIVDKTAPRFASMDTSDFANGNITVAMTETLDPAAIARENFTVSINGVEQTKLDKDGVAQPTFGASIDGNTIVLTGLSFNNGDSIKVAYADRSSTDAFPGLKDVAGNNAVGFTSITSTLGSPTAIITMSDTALKVGETATVTITFSEAVQNFGNSDMTVEGGTLGALSTTDNIVWTATFTPNANYENNGNAISISGAYTDLSGNVGSTDSITYDIDTLAPTITITDNEPAAIGNIVGGTITYTLTFSENVTGFTVDDISVSGGDKTSFSGSGSSYTLVVTPTGGFEGNITVDVAGAKAIDAAGNSNTAAQSVQAVDMKAPTLVITDDESADTANIAGGDIIYTFTFSENVVGFTADDIAVANGIKGLFSGSGSSYTLVVSPITGSTAPITIDVLGVNQVDVSGNTGADKTASQAVDMSAPTATVTMSDSALKIGETSTVTIAFSEAVIGFSNADVTASNGTLGTFTTANGGITWTATFTPTVNIENTANSITLADSYTDVNLNTGTAATSDNYTIDTIAPTVTITNDQVGTANISGGDILYTFTFSEAVTGFTVADVAVVGGTKALALIQTSPTTYTLLVTPTGTGTVAVNIADGTTTGITDTAGNLSIAAFQSTQAVDMVAPTVVSVILADTALTIGQTSAVTITFSEAVSGFDNTDVSLAGAKGTLGTLTSADNITWTGLFTPTELTSDASNIIQVLNTYTDVASNHGTLGVSGNFTIDTRPSPVAAPTLVLTTDTAGTDINLDGSITIADKNTDGITNVNGITVTLATGITNWEYSLNGGTTWTTGATPTVVLGVTSSTFNLTANTSYTAGQIQVRQTDSDGNVSTIATNTQTTIVDTIVAIPTIAVIAANDVIDASENANLIISGTGEAGATVTLAVTNQTAVVDASGAWNITVLDPATSFAQGSEALSVTQTDVAGTTSLAATRNIFIDTVRPILDPLIDVKANIGADSIALTFNENLAPVDFASAGSFIVEINGIVYDSDSAIKSSELISAVATTDKIVTLIFDTNIHNINLGDTIRVGYIGATGGSTTAIQDLIGNDAASFGYVTATVENTDTPPVLTNMIANGANVTLTFNEALNASTTNLPEASDFTVKVNGNITAVTGVSITGYNVALTTAYTNNDLVEVTYKNNASTTNVIQDLIGNDALSFTYTSTADTIPPTATITMADTALKIGDTSLVTIAFSEAVTNFSNADVTVANGGLSAFGSVDGGVTWTATFTPTNNVEDTTNVITLATTYNDLAGNVGTVASSANYTIDTIAPTFVSMVADESLDTIVMTFSENLDITNLPTDGQFAISLNGGADLAATQYSVAASGSTLTLTLDDLLIVNTQTAKVTYTDSTAGNDVLAIQDLFGNDTLTFNNTVNAVL